MYHVTHQVKCHSAPFIWKSPPCSTLSPHSLTWLCVRMQLQHVMTKTSGFSLSTFFPLQQKNWLSLSMHFKIPLGWRKLLFVNGVHRIWNSNSHNRFCPENCACWLYSIFWNKKWLLELFLQKSIHILFKLFCKIWIYFWATFISNVQSNIGLTKPPQC